MSFLKKLFGGGSKTEQLPPEQEHNGFAIKATPYQENGQWQMCGVISRQIGEELKEHRFVRADRFPSREDAVEFTFTKARQIIDMQGDRLFG